MRLKFILNGPVQQEYGGTCIACLGGSLVVVLAESFFFADWLEVQ